MPSSIIIAASLEAAATWVIAAKFIVTYAASYLVTKMFAPKQKSGQDNGVRQQIPPSSENRIPVAYGEAWMGGTFVDAVLSTDNQTMYYVLAISHVSPDGQLVYDTTKFYYGDRVITFGTGASVASLTDGSGNVDTKIAGYLDINLYTSTAAGTITTVLGSAPDVVMGGSDIDVSLRWPAFGRQMNGLAFAIVKLKYSADAGTTSLQPITFKISHTLNGTGVAKPGSVFKDYITNSVYGGAVPIANVNTTSCAALDSYSDELITYTQSGGGTSTQPRYRINGVLDTGENVLSNIDNILAACDSWISYQAATGQWSPIINKAESSSFSFDDSNIIGEIRVSATDITQSINQVEASFPWKDNKDQPNTIFVKTPTALLYPNEPVNKYTTTLSLVNDSVQAEYLCNRMLEQAREDLIVSFNTAYTGIQVNAGDVVSVTNSSYGWTDKLFRVIKVNETSLPDGNLGARIELNEYNAAVYDDGSITKYAPAANSGIESVFFFSSLTAPTITDIDDKAVTPSFSVSCSIPAKGRCTTITLYYTKSATPSASDWIEWGSQSLPNSQAYTPSSTVKFQNITLPDDSYYFAYKVSNESAMSSLSSASAVFTWASSIPGQTIVYKTSDAGPVTITGVSHVPDGFNSSWNTNFANISFTAPYTGRVTINITGNAYYVNSDTLYLSGATWSIQDNGGTFDGTAKLNQGVQAGTTTYFPVTATRTFDIVAGNAYTFGGWANKLNSGDTFLVANLFLVATISNQ